MLVCGIAFYLILTSPVGSNVSASQWFVYSTSLLSSTPFSKSILGSLLIQSIQVPSPNIQSSLLYKQASLLTIISYCDATSNPFFSHVSHTMWECCAVNAHVAELNRSVVLNTSLNSYDTFLKIILSLFFTGNNHQLCWVMS